MVPGERYSGGQVVALLAPLPAWLGLVFWNELGGFGLGRQTYGKRLLGLQVVSAADGTPASLGQAWARASLVVLAGVIAAGATVAAGLSPLAAGAPAIGLVSLVALGAPLLGRDGRGLHDRICGTRLVRPR